MSENPLRPGRVIRTDDPKAALGPDFFVVGYVTADEAREMIDRARQELREEAAVMAAEAVKAHLGRFMTHEAIDVRNEEVLRRLVCLEKALGIGEPGSMGVPIPSRLGGGFLVPPQANKAEVIDTRLAVVEQRVAELALATHGANATVGRTLESVQTMCKRMLWLVENGEGGLWGLVRRRLAERRRRKGRKETT